VDREITGLRQHDRGQWMAELTCGHARHVRHRRPFEDRAWLLTEVGRDGRVGTPIGCGDCDREGRDAIAVAPEGGEPPCWAAQVCDACGALVTSDELDGVGPRANHRCTTSGPTGR
jgi:hypothetical protein